MKTTALVTLLVLMLAPLQVTAQRISEYPGENSKLTERIEWASRSAKGEDGYWMAYSISKFMHEGSWMGRIGGKDWGSRKSLYALLGKAHLEEKRPEELRRNLSFTSEGVFHIRRREAGDDLFLKEIGVLFYFKSPGSVPTEIRLSSMSLGIDLQGKSLFWLGKSTDAESAAYLRSLFETSKDEDLRCDVLRSMAVHENRADNFDFFAGVLEHDPSEEIREDAAFWVGQLDLPKGLVLLTQVVAKDPSMDVREKAVFAIGQMSSVAAQDKLIDLARNEKNREVRKQAIFWLGQKASNQATRVLEEMVFDDADTEVQAQAVHALAQMPADRSIPKLIEIAQTHPNMAVRKKAIFWLGDSGDPRAVDVLIEMVQNSR